MNKIAIDLDSTLLDFEGAAREAWYELYKESGDKEKFFKGMFVPWVEWRSPADILGQEEWSRVIDRVHDDNKILEQVPLSGSVRVLEAIADEHQITYISNRKTESFAATYEWLSKYFPPGELVCTMENKQSLLSEFQYLIDDRPKTLIEFVFDWDWKYLHGSTNAHKQRLAFGLSYEYSRALSDIPNIYLAPNWLGIHHYLIDKQILKEKTYA